MFAAVWWTQGKSWSVIDVKTIVSGDATSGSYVYALHKDIPYEAKILRMSDDFDELKAIKVNADGTVHYEKALLPQSAMVSSKKTKKQFKTKASASASCQLQKAAAHSDCTPLSPVYTYATTTESGPSPTDSVPAMRRPSRPMPAATPEVLNYLKCLVAWLEDQGEAGHPQLSACMVPMVPNQNKQPSVSPVFPSTPCGEDDLPFPLPPISDPTLLYVGHSVEISKGLRSTLLRKYCENPEEMTRQLILNLVGIPNLKLMRPRRHGESPYRPIPPRIMAAIDDFVLGNNKLVTFTKSKLTKVVSNYINKLRLPEREHKRKLEAEGLSKMEEGKKCETKKGRREEQHQQGEKKRKRESDIESTSSVEGSSSLQMDSSGMKTAGKEFQKSTSKSITSLRKTLPYTGNSPSTSSRLRSPVSQAVTTCPQTSPWKVELTAQPSSHSAIRRNLFDMDLQQPSQSDPEMISSQETIHPPYVPYAIYQDL